MIQEKIRAGDVFENPVTGERAVVRMADGEVAISDLYVAPGGAVAGEHVHPGIEEVFTVVSGLVGFRLDGREDVAGPGRRLLVPPGMAHYWWNAGDDRRTSWSSCGGRRSFSKVS